MFKALVAVFVEVGEHAKAGFGGEAVVGFIEARVWGEGGSDGKGWVEVFSLGWWDRH